MSERSGREPQGPGLREEMGFWGRSALHDLADEARFVLLFLVVMVPAGAVGYVVDGGAGAVVGALVGGALVVAWMVLAAGWLLVRTVRRWRDRSGDRSRR